MLEFYTYLHCRPDGTPFYVGKGRGKRCRDFSHNRNRHHRNIVAKHGAENVGVFVFPCDSEEQAFADEIQQIAQLRREGYALCNLTTGGEGGGGMVFSDATCAKRSETQKGKRHSVETRAKISAANKGQVGNRGHLGHKHTDEAKAKVSAANTGRVSAFKEKAYSAEARAKMSKAAKQRGVPLVAIEKSRLANKGKPWSAARRAAQEKKS